MDQARAEKLAYPNFWTLSVIFGYVVGHLILTNFHPGGPTVRGLLAELDKDWF